MDIGKEKLSIACIITLFTICFAYTGLVIISNVALDNWIILVGGITYVIAIYYLVKTIRYEKRESYKEEGGIL